MFPDFPNEAPTPQAPTAAETIRYCFHENERRALESMEGLTPAQVNHEPGHGAWSIGALLKHQNDLLRMMNETLAPGSTRDIDFAGIGEAGTWKLETLTRVRERLASRFLENLAAIEPDGLMETRPDAYPPRWAEWPILMRILRPLLDIATHIGQVNYARRQLGNPVGGAR